MKPVTNHTSKRRILGRRVAKEMTIEQLRAVTGGTTSCSCGQADDCDQPANQY